jgi:hypothetical protein
MIRTAVVIGIMALTTPAFATEVSQCGQVVTERDTGTLSGDLTCDRTIPGFCFACPFNHCGVDLTQPCAEDPDCASGRCIHAAIRLGNQASLDLAGFAVQGALGDEPEIGVLCERRCTVRGPGEVAHFVDYGIRVGGVGAGPKVTAGIARIEQVEVHDTSNGTGIEGFRLTLEDVTSNSNGLGISARSIRALNVTASHNDPYMGISVGRLSGTNVTTNENAYDGLFFSVIPGNLRLTNFTSMGNAGFGVRAWGLVLTDSSVAGNGGFGTGVDVATVKRPRLVNSSCGESGQLSPSNPFGGSLSGPWGVCAGD